VSVHAICADSGNPHGVTVSGSVWDVCGLRRLAVCRFFTKLATSHCLVVLLVSKQGSGTTLCLFVVY
jgi:hypothetical protein